MNDGKSVALAKEIDEFSNEYKGVFNIASVNCAEEPGICEKEKVKDFPTVRVYPPLPLPSIDVVAKSDVVTTQEIY